MSVILITGCSSGFGVETAVAFARRGDTVYATMRNPTKSDALIAAAQPDHVEVLQLDVTDDASVQAAVDQVLAATGRIDVLVNNAGLGPYGTVELIPWDWFRETFETNFWGPVRMMRAVLPTMRAQASGAIVNVTSVAGRIPGGPAVSAYGASKHAICNLTESLAIEVEPFGITVTSIEPGFFKTSIIDSAKSVDDPTSPYADIEGAAIASERAGFDAGGHPSVVAQAIVDAATKPGPLHVPIGDDANEWLVAANGMTFEEWVAATSQTAS